MVSDNSSVFYKYNSYGDVIKKTEHFQGQTDFITNYEYDSKHRLIRKVYPSNFAIKYIYDNFGYLEVITKNNGQPVWRALSYNASMQVESYESGDQIETINTYNNNYLATTTSTKMGYQNPFHNMEFTWDFTTGGNLSMRKDYVTNNVEMFGYEAQRCTSGYVMDEGPQFSVTYENSGNIHTKSDAGTYAYEGTPHAVTKISDITGIFPVAIQGMSYNELNKAATLDEAGYHMEISYGVTGERFKEELKLNNNPQWTKYYSEDYEKVDFADGSTKEYHYISAPSGLVAVYINDENTNPLYYTFSDHLGSITTLADESGNVVERMSFDAWGRRRNPDDWSYNNMQDPYTYILSRGYTSHEHLDMFGLINMNGRMYDPVVGRFLSPDNFVQETGSQGLNRYSYCLNNPLKYVDPEGESIVAAMIVAGVFGGAINTLSNMYEITHAKKPLEAAAGYFLVGAAVGVLGAATAGGISAGLGAINVGGFAGGFIAGGISGGLAGFTLQAGNLRVEGKKDLREHQDILIQATLSGAISGAIVGGLLSGIEAKSRGNSFWDGNRITCPNGKCLPLPSSGISEPKEWFNFKDGEINTWEEIGEPIDINENMVIGGDGQYDWNFEYDSQYKIKINATRFRDVGSPAGTYYDATVKSGRISANFGRGTNDYNNWNWTTDKASYSLYSKQPHGFKYPGFNWGLLKSGIRSIIH